MTGAQNLRLLATVGGHDTATIPAILERVGLADRGNDRFGSYSMGMKQRLSIATALLGPPELLMLDEPINGLDPAGIRHVRQLIGDLAEQGRTLFISSHVLAELQHVCNWLVIIDNGTVAYQGPADEFLARAESHITARPHNPDSLDRLNDIATGLGCATDAGENGSIVIHPHGDTAHDLAARLNQRAFADDIVLAELRVEREQLEDRYLALIQHNEETVR